MILTTRRLFTAILFIALFVMATREIADPDFWWHLRAGQVIFETASVPHVDIFSFTRAGQPWVAHEWLSELLIYLIFRFGSYPALILTFSFIISLSFVLVWARCQGKPYVAAFALLLAAFATAPTWGVRPQMLTLLLTSVFLLLLERYRHKGNVRSLYLLPPLMLLWVNLHSGFAVGLALIAAYLFGAGVQRLISRPRARANAVDEAIRHSPDDQFRPNLTALALVFVICLLVVPLNPNGATMFVYPFETLTSQAMQTYIQEWFSPNFHQSEFQPFALLLLMTLGAVALSPKRTPQTHVLLLVLFGYAALRSSRNIPIFVLVATPVLSEHAMALLNATGWLQALETRPLLPRTWQALNWVLLALVAGAAVLRIGAVVSNQTSVERAKFPARAVDYLQSNGLSGPIFNSYSWGGYLIWRRAPGERVYIDGRADVYGDAFMEAYSGAYQGEPGWQALFDKYQIETVLVEPNAPIAGTLKHRVGWNQVYADSQAVIYLRCKADCGD